MNLLQKCAAAFDRLLPYAQAKQSAYFPEMVSRLAPLAELESFLDSNEIVFRFNEKIQKFSLIKADYLLENQYKGNDVFSLYFPKLSIRF